MLPYLQICRAKGRDYGYYRRAGIRTRIAGAIGSLEFLAAYQVIHQAAEAAAKPRPEAPDIIPGSLHALWLAYKASGEWRALTESTKKEYRRFIEPLLAGHGEKPVRRLPPEWIMLQLDALSATPGKARHFLAVIRLLLNWSIPRGWIKTNPAAHIKLPRHKVQSHRVWNNAEIEVMTGPDAGEIALAVTLALYTAQRLGDVLRMPWSAYDGASITLTQGKTGARLIIPAHPALSQALSQAPRKAVVICTRPDGAAWKIDHFKHRFAAIRARLEMPDALHFHGLRHSAASRLAEAGCSTHEIAAITGHKTLSMVSRYTQGAQQQALATAAIARLPGQKSNTSGKPQKKQV